MRTLFRLDVNHLLSARCRRTRPKTNRSGLRVEALEGRKLLAAAIMDGVSGDQAEANQSPPPAAIVASTNVSSIVKDSTTPQIVPYIVNGQTASDYTSVGIVNNGCSGTLISPTHVLTAGHCVEDSDNSSGFLNDTDGTFEVNGEVYRTVKVTPHPGYDSNSLLNDLAMMELDRPVTGVTPSRIMTQAPEVGQLLTIVGFGEGGTTQDPQFDFGNKRVGETPIDEVTPTTITWVFEAGESNTAPGDSGGPAFVTVNGEQYLAGITSGGYGNAHQYGDESFDTRVDAFASWIQDQLGTTTPTDPTKPTDPIDHGNENLTASDLANEELANYDSDGNGSLSIDELTVEFTDMGMSQEGATESVSELMDFFDDDGSRDLSLSELVISWGGEISEPSIPDPSVSDPGQDESDDHDAAALATEELDLFDVDQDGYLTLDELTTEFLDQGIDEAESLEYAQNLLTEYDTDFDNQLSYVELVVSWGGDHADGITDDGQDPVDPSTQPEEGSSEQLANEELGIYDTDGNGSLTGEELEAEGIAIGLDQEGATDFANDLLNSFDADGDNQLSFAELVVSWGGAEADADAEDDVIATDDLDLDAAWADDSDWWNSELEILC